MGNNGTDNTTSVLQQVAKLKQPPQPSFHLIFDNLVTKINNIHSNFTLLDNALQR